MSSVYYHMSLNDVGYTSETTPTARHCKRLRAFSSERKHDDSGHRNENVILRTLQRPGDNVYVSFQNAKLSWKRPEI